MTLRPSQNRILNYLNPKGNKLVTRLRVNLSHFCVHRFKHSFQKTLNLIYSCGQDIETSSHFFFTVQTIYMAG